jgi:hypothetical protein
LNARLGDANPRTPKLKKVVSGYAVNQDQCLPAYATVPKSAFAAATFCRWKEPRPCASIRPRRRWPNPRSCS